MSTTSPSSHSSITRIRRTDSSFCLRGGQRNFSSGAAAAPTPPRIPRTNLLAGVTRQVCAKLLLRDSVNFRACRDCPLQLFLGGSEHIAEPNVRHLARLGALPHDLLMSAGRPVPPRIARGENGSYRNAEGIGNVHRSALVADEKVAASNESHELAQRRSEVTCGSSKRECCSVTFRVNQHYYARAIGLGQRVCDFGESLDRPPLGRLAASHVKRDNQIARGDSHRFQGCSSRLPLFRKKRQAGRNGSPALAAGNSLRAALRAERFHQLQPIPDLVLPARRRWNGVGEQEAPSAERVANTASRVCRKRQDVVPYVHSAVDREVELRLAQTADERRQRAAIVPRQSILVGACGPRKNERYDFVHEPAPAKQVLRVRLCQQRDPRVGIARSKGLQCGGGDDNIANAPDLDHEDFPDAFNRAALAREQDRRERSGKRIQRCQQHSPPWSYPPGLSHGSSSCVHFLKKLVLLPGDFFPRVILPDSLGPHVSQLGHPLGISFESAYLAGERGFVAGEKNAALFQHLTIEYRVEGEDAIPIAHRLEQGWICPANRMAVQIHEAIAVELLDHFLIVDVPGEDNAIAGKRPQLAMKRAVVVCATGNEQLPGGSGRSE